jgi:phosphoribosyl 1,2-cyclic phosphate phosphodiesterase
MQLRFLGTGTSAGIPVIACECAICTSTDPRDTRTRCSATLEFIDDTGQERVILIDTSPDFRQQVLRAGTQRIDAILFTHNHVDHTFGLDEVRRFNEVMKQSIPIFADEHTMNALGRVYQHIFSPHTNIQSSFIASLDPTIIFPYEPFTLFGLTITPLTLMHGKQPILGYLFEQPGETSELLPLAYCTDVCSIPERSFEILERAKTLVLDALRDRPHRTHFTVEQAVEAAARIDASRTYLIHMTHDLMHEPTDRALPDGINLAYDGLVLPQ